MALSGSQNFTITRDDLIKTALQHVGAIGDGVTPSVTQLSEVSLLLNMLIKHWQADDIQLWVTKYGYILPVSNVSKVALGADGGNAVTSYVTTTTSATSSSGGSTVTLTSVTGVLNTYVIGIEQTDGTMQWTTVNGAPVGSVVTLAATLTGNVASGANVYVYNPSNTLTRPAEIIEAFIRNTDNIDTPITKIDAKEYNLLGSKTEEGTINQWFYDKTLGFGASGYPGNGDFYFWPTFENGDNVIVIRYVKIFDDLDAAGDNVEFPQVWFLPLMVGLAWLLAPKHGIPLKERQMLMQEMMMLKQAEKEYDQESGSLYITVNKDGS